MSYTLAWILKCLKLYPSISLIDDSAAATQPLSHSATVAARVAGAATQPLCHSRWSSHSATQSLRVAEWLRQPLCQSGWVADVKISAIARSIKLSMNSGRDCISILNALCSTISWSNPDVANLMPSLEVTRNFVMWCSFTALRLGVCSSCWWQRNFGACSWVSTRKTFRWTKMLQTLKCKIHLETSKKQP